MFPLILLYVVLTIVRPQEYMPALMGVPVLPVTLGLAFVCWFFSRKRTFAAPQFAILPVFLVVVMISEIVNGWAGGALAQLQRFGPTVVAFFVLAAACTDRRRVIITMGVMVLCATVLALHGVQQSRTGIGWTGVLAGEDGRIQYTGIFNDPNDLGLLFVAVLPMAVFLSRYGGFLGRLFWLGCALLLMYGIYLTNSRGALLAVLIVAGFYVWHRRGLLTAGVLGAVGLACMKMLSSRMQELDAGEESANGRVDAWYTGLDLFKSHPVFGVGAGNFTDYNDLTAHNSLVLVLAETGFVGYVLWLAFVGYSLWMMLVVLRSKPDAASEPEQFAQWQAERPLTLTLLLSMCGMFACAFFLSRSYMVVLYLILALATGYYVGLRQRLTWLPQFTLGKGGWRWVPAAAGSVAGLYLLVAVLLRTVG
jgi:putative inorganic carbon (HCO3(-)) transporter